MLAIYGWKLYLAVAITWIVTTSNMHTHWEAYETKLRLGRTTITQNNFALAVVGHYLLVPTIMLIVYTTARQYDMLFPGWPTLLAGVIAYSLVYGLASKV